MGAISRSQSDRWPTIVTLLLAFQYDTAIERLRWTRVVPVQLRELLDFRSRNGHGMFQHEPRHVFTARRSSKGAQKGVVAVIGGKQPIRIDLDILLGFDFFFFLRHVFP